jgi:hypothetical protein
MSGDMIYPATKACGAIFFFGRTVTADHTGGNSGDYSAWRITFIPRHLSTITLQLYKSTVCRRMNCDHGADHWFSMNKGFHHASSWQVRPESG